MIKVKMSEECQLELTLRNNIFWSPGDRKVPFLKVDENEVIIEDTLLTDLSVYHLLQVLRIPKPRWWRLVAKYKRGKARRATVKALTALVLGTTWGCELNTSTGSAEQ